MSAKYYIIGPLNLHLLKPLVLLFSNCWRNNQLQRHVGRAHWVGPARSDPIYKTIRYLQKDVYPEYIKIDFYLIKYGIRYLIVWHQLKR
jgi:hypothetical protein